MSFFINFGGVSGGTGGGDGIIPSAHSNLTGLGYEESGHTGFASATELALANQQLNEISTNLDTTTTRLAQITYDNSGARNAIYRGKYLGSTVTTQQYQAISSGAFTDMYIGDYWTIGGVNYRIAAFNYYRLAGDTSTSANHVTLVPDSNLYIHVMNDTNITTGGYTGSKMYAQGLEQAKTTVKAAFGNHVLKHRKLLSNATTDGKASGWAWVDSEVDLMNEVMAYGSIVWGESTIGGSGYNIGDGKSQLPLFMFRPDLISNRQYYWLRDVVSAAYFATVNNYGYAGSHNASFAGGVRPAFSIS